MTVEEEKDKDRINGDELIKHQQFVYHCKFGTVHRIGKMCVTFNIDPRSHEKILVSSYDVQDDIATDLPRHVSPTELAFEKAKKMSEDVLNSRSVKINIQFPIFKEMALRSCRRRPEDVLPSKMASSRFLIHLFLQLCKNITTVRNRGDTMASGEPTKSLPRWLHDRAWSKMQRNTFCLVMNVNLIRQGSEKVWTPWQPPSCSLGFCRVEKERRESETYASFPFLHWWIHQNGGRTSWGIRREQCYGCQIFKNVKVIKSDNGLVFRSKRLEQWAQQWGISLKFSAPYHQGFPKFWNVPGFSWMLEVSACDSVSS